MNILKNSTTESQWDEENSIPLDSGLNAEQPQIVAYINYPSNCNIFDTKWIPTFPTKFIVAGGISKSETCGSIQIYSMNENKLDIEKTVEKKVAFRCASFDAIVRNTSVSLGTFHGNLQIFDMERFDFPIYDVSAHDGIVNCLDGIGGENGAAEIVTGGNDGSIKVWDPRQKLPVVCISAVSENDGGNGHRDCWSVNFADGYSQEDRVICAGFDNGDIKVIDLKMMKERWGCNVGSGVCKVCCNKKYEKMSRLVAGTVDGRIHVLGMENQELDNKHADYRHTLIATEPLGSAIWSVNHLPQSDNIFAACNGGSVDVWRHSNSSSAGSHQPKVEQLKLLTKANLSSQSIHCFDWNPHFRGLALCGSFDQTIRILVAADV